MRIGDRVRINSPETSRLGKSRFHGRTGKPAYRSDIGKRWFVHLDGDKDGIDVEFFPSEIVVIGNPVKGPKDKKKGS